MLNFLKNMLAIVGIIGVIVAITTYNTASAYQQGLATGIAAGQKQVDNWKSDRQVLNQVCTNWWFHPVNRLSKRKPK